MNALPFMAEIYVSPEEAEIRDWLKANRAHLKDWAPDEIARLAVLAGFEMADVCMVLSTFRDAMDGTHIDRRYAMQSWVFDRTVEHVAQMRRELEKPKPFDLMPLWRELVANTITGE